MQVNTPAQEDLHKKKKKTKNLPLGIAGIVVDIPPLAAPSPVVVVFELQT